MHSSLAEDLGLESEEFTSIADDDQLFHWLAESLVPAVSDRSKGSTVQPVDVSNQVVHAQSGEKSEMESICPLNTSNSGGCIWFQPSSG